MSSPITPSKQYGRSFTPVDSIFCRRPTANPYIFESDDETNGYNKEAHSDKSFTDQKCKTAPEGINQSQLGNKTHSYEEETEIQQRKRNGRITVSVSVDCPQGDILNGHNQLHATFCDNNIATFCDNNIECAASSIKDERSERNKKKKNKKFKLCNLSEQLHECASPSKGADEIVGDNTAKLDTDSSPDVECSNKRKRKRNKKEKVVDGCNDLDDEMVASSNKNIYGKSSPSTECSKKKKSKRKKRDQNVDGCEDIDGEMVGNSIENLNGESSPATECIKKKKSKRKKREQDVDVCEYLDGATMSQAKFDRDSVPAVKSGKKKHKSKRSKQDINRQDDQDGEMNNSEVKLNENISHVMMQRNKKHKQTKNNEDGERKEDGDCADELQIKPCNNNSSIGKSRKDRRCKKGGDNDVDEDVSHNQGYRVEKNKMTECSAGIKSYADSSIVTANGKKQRPKKTKHIVANEEPASIDMTEENAEFQLCAEMACKNGNTVVEVKRRKNSKKTVKDLANTTYGAEIQCSVDHAIAKRKTKSKRQGKTDVSKNTDVNHCTAGNAGIYGHSMDNSKNEPEAAGVEKSSKNRKLKSTAAKSEMLTSYSDADSEICVKAAHSIETGSDVIASVGEDPRKRSIAGNVVKEELTRTHSTAGGSNAIVETTSSNEKMLHLDYNNVTRRRGNAFEMDQADGMCVEELAECSKMLRGSVVITEGVEIEYTYRSRTNVQLASNKKKSRAKSQRVSFTKEPPSSLFDMEQAEVLSPCVANVSADAAVADNDVSSSVLTGLLIKNGRKNKQIKSDTKTAHMKTESVHAELRRAISFQCSICSKIFPRKYNRDRHEATHGEQETPYQCSVCGQKFSRKNHCDTHILSHEDDSLTRAHQCAICGRSFKRSNHLQGHMAIHSNAKPHECDICGKTFTQKSNLKTHRRTHANEKPHHCDDCSLSFTLKHQLERHRLTHLGIKPHKCTICGKAYTQVNSLYRHAKTHEENVEEM